MNWNYLFKHWFGTLLIAPIIAHIIAFINNDYNQIFAFLEYYLLFLIFGLFFSTPTYMFYGFLYWFLSMKEINTNYSKLILIAFAIVGIVITFWLIGGTFSFKGALSYSLSSIVTGLIFKLNYKK